MAERIVINTGPLIVLSRIEALDIVGHLSYRFICPDAVRLELDKGESSGYPRIAPTWLQVIPVATAPSPIILAALDLGEAAVIQLALEQKMRIVCIDEWRRKTGCSCLRIKGHRGTGSIGQSKKRWYHSRDDSLRGKGAPFRCSISS
jgi:predicted nucleic acid-binding protein